jgi:hypothetical protein
MHEHEILMNRLRKRVVTHNLPRRLFGISRTGKISSIALMG